MPRGTAKRGGNLPPGLEKRIEPLPVELERQLPALPVGCGCRRVIIGTNVVLIRTRNHFVLDVLHLGSK
jgi:hypothetical protein